MDYKLAKIRYLFCATTIENLFYKLIGCVSTQAWLYVSFQNRAEVQKLVTEATYWIKVEIQI